MRRRHAPNHRSRRREGRLGSAACRRKRVQAGHRLGCADRKRSRASARRAACSRARSARRSATARKRQRHASQAVRNLRQHPPGPRIAGRDDAVQRPRHRPRRRPRKRRGPLRRHRAHADARRRPVPEADFAQGLREDRPPGVRVRPGRGPQEGRLRDQVEHHEDDRRATSSAPSRRSPRSIPTSKAGTSSSTTAATSSSRSRSSST